MDFSNKITRNMMKVMRVKWMNGVLKQCNYSMMSVKWMEFNVTRTWWFVCWIEKNANPISKSFVVYDPHCDESGSESTYHEYNSKEVQLEVVYANHVSEEEEGEEKVVTHSSALWGLKWERMRIALNCSLLKEIWTQVVQPIS